MPTPQQLIDYATSLTAFAAKLSDYAVSQANQLAPSTVALHKKALEIADEANLLGQTGLDLLANDVAVQLDNLSAQVGRAKTALADIADAKNAFSIAAAVLATAAAIASGNLFGAAGGIANLAQTLQSAIAANSGS